MDWETDKRVARTMLRDRGTRRKIMARLLMVALALMGLGLWVVDGWLARNVWAFLLWWGACAFFTCMTMLMAVYDMARVVREERGD